jgi:DNA-directed RNA polymerase I subunit RPA1
MHNSSSNVVVRSEVTETVFGLYSNQEVKNSVSVCRITEQNSIDEDGKPIPNGLYDARMGPLDAGFGPTSGSTVCGTCQSNYHTCPGHVGHIELSVPVYYPLLFPSLYLLLRAKCLKCHSLRMWNSRVRAYLVKLKLIEMGDVSGAKEIDEESVKPNGKVSEMADLLEDDQTEEEAAQRSGSKQTSREEILDKAEERFNGFCGLSNEAKKRASDKYSKDYQREVIKAFNKAIVACKKCENCGFDSPRFRKDGFTKIFRKASTSRSKESKKFKVKSALEETQKLARAGTADALDDSDDSDDATDSDDDSDDDKKNDRANMTEAEKKAADNDDQKDTYLVPSEVEAQIQMLWGQNKAILDFIWSRALNHSVTRESTYWTNTDHDEVWRIFFTRVILVAPNKFRPNAKIGESNAEHPQTLHLLKIMEQDMKIQLASSGITLVDVSISYKENLLASQKALKALAKSGGAPAAPVVAPGAVKRLEVITDARDARAEKDGRTVHQGMNLSNITGMWIDLQNAVNCYMDSAKDTNPLARQGPSGIRQLLERKEGLFRSNMMGKRVNYCCRSVISPDPYIGTDEIGIPVHFAKTLQYPVPVNDWNVKYLRKLVERGPNNYPGANLIETADGRVIRLDKLSDREREGKAKLLLSQPGNKVYRHLINGDPLLVNRQPTLHKPGIMAHKARILQHVSEQTIRMHYANCNTYNADFDGDEMNCHFVQSDLARAEAQYICNTDNQYIVPTSGTPLRGLIQDHVASGVKMTCKNTFLTKAEFQQLLYVAVSGLPGSEMVTAREDMQMPCPAVLKPRQLWTGKQVVSTLIKHLCRAPLPPLNLDGKCKTSNTTFGDDQGEHIIIFRQSELLTGVLDKASMGASTLGVVHAVYELYGPEMAGKLLSAFGRLFTLYLQDAGHSCGIEDLVLTKDADEERIRLLKHVSSQAEKGLKVFLANSVPGAECLDSEDGNTDEENELGLSAKEQRQCEIDGEKFLLGTADRVMQKVKLDSEMQSIINQSASEVIKVCLPNGLERPFLQNNFSMMVITGAKGSAVNQSQISCFLGQQALEGQRVPVMISGKSLPSFRPFDTSARAGGFVRDRFLTGIKPQEYYFHCMAGREGLVDTAVKTSRSGYLQRCLVKHLEELKINYDMTVRDSAGNVVQFLYGEDGLDTTSAALLGGTSEQMRFLARNKEAFSYKYSLHRGSFNGLDSDSGVRHLSDMDGAQRVIDKVAANSSRGNNDRCAVALSKNDVVLARRKRVGSMPWARGNLLPSQWEPATVIKIRNKDRDSISSSASTSSSNIPTYDLQYVDGTVEKKVPAWLNHRPQLSSGGGPNMVQAGKLPIPLIRAGLPDPALHSLPLGNTIGACSETVQRAINDYIKANLDGLVKGEGSMTSVTAEGLMLLVWVKYMRSLACPGEAVGCIAAQSVGEPSTQMTLNTFHLAGHGGANVTLGIPRLREIIMTASKNLKTPTMTVPLAKGGTELEAKNLARKLSRLPLSSLLHHEGGVEVGEMIARASSASRWERRYRIRLQCQDPIKIKQAFAVDFSSVVRAVIDTFIPRLSYLIKVEQRRSGDKTSGKHDPLKNFRSNTKVSAADYGEGVTKGGGEWAGEGEADEGGGDAGDEAQPDKAKKGGATKGADGCRFGPRRHADALT